VFFILKIFLARSTENVAAEEEKKTLLDWKQIYLLASISLRPDTTAMFQDIMQNIAGVDCMMN
jgi:hypothetical protein